MRSLMKIKPEMAKSLSFTVVGKSCTSGECLTWQISILTLFRENKILTKISEFTVISY